MRFVSKEAATFEQYSKARPHFHDVIPSERFCPNGFRNYIILNQTCSKLRNDSIEDSEEDNRLKKKIDFSELGKDAKSVAGFPPSRQFRFRRNDVT